MQIGVRIILAAMLHVDANKMTRLQGHSEGIFRRGAISETADRSKERKKSLKTRICQLSLQPTWFLRSVDTIPATFLLVYNIIAYVSTDDLIVFLTLLQR